MQSQASGRSSAAEEGKAQTPASVVVAVSPGLARPDERQQVAQVGAGTRACRPGCGRREHWDITPRDGKEVLIMVDVVTAVPTDATMHSLVIRDRASAWTPEFRQVRTDMGIPATPPRR